MKPPIFYNQRRRFLSRNRLRVYTSGGSRSLLFYVCLPLPLPHSMAKPYHHQCNVQLTKRRLLSVSLPVTSIGLVL